MYSKKNSNDAIFIKALADLANFISVMKTTHNLTDSKWVAFGGSYPGSLAAWLRGHSIHKIR